MAQSRARCQDLFSAHTTARDLIVVDELEVARTMRRSMRDCKSPGTLLLCAFDLQRHMQEGLRGALFVTLASKATTRKAKAVYSRYWELGVLTFA